ncbi:hypothetical protein AB0J86_16355 [Micromonospora sp. NPDC049559]|uniref:hypothetical protein n=1 Tax=Micromonospora sp. NPDC049559 TaxID=3155923 RepID=UPI00344050FF
MSGHDLERRYRRLLAVYPWEHRRRYEEEMLAVLLASARPDQRRPGLAESANLIRSGLRARLGTTARGLAGPGWADGAAVTGLLAALVLVALGGFALTRLASQPASEPELSPYFVGHLDAADWLHLIGWGAVCVGVLAGLPRTAAALAWAAVVAQAVVLPGQYQTNPVTTVNSLWQFALALVAAAALTVPAPRRRALAALGARRLLAVALALALVDGLFLVSRFKEVETLGPGAGSYHVLGVYAPLDGASRAELISFSALGGWLNLAGVAAAGLTLLVAVATLAGPVRRRVAALLAPVAALVVLVDSTLDGWASSNSYLDHHVGLVPAQWTVLVAAPLLTFALGVLLVRRREHTLQMVALGRAADREGSVADS